MLNIECVQDELYIELLSGCCYCLIAMLRLHFHRKHDRAGNNTPAYAVHDHVEKLGNHVVGTCC